MTAIHPHEDREPLSNRAITGESRGSLTQIAYRTLEELIVTLQLPPGAVMSETAVADRVGIGRTPVREALQMLAREGLIEVMPRRGIRISCIDGECQLRLLELRRALEQVLAEACAERATDAEKNEFDALATAMEAAAETDDDVAFMRLDRRFNQLLCAAARNEYVASAMKLIQGLSRRFWYSHYRDALDLPLCAQLHANVARSISVGKAAKAVAASDRLIDYIEDFARASTATTSKTNGHQ